MPLKQQRTRARAELRSRQKNAKGSSSNEEMDSCSAQEIVARLASKYLLKSSTDTENEKENNKKKIKVFDPYDADLEYSTTDMESQNSACEMETNAKKNNKRGQKKPAQRKNAKYKQPIQPKPTKAMQSGISKNRGKTERKKLLNSNSESNTQSDSLTLKEPNESKTYKKSKKHSVSFSDIISMEFEGHTLSQHSHTSDVSNQTSKEILKESKFGNESIPSEVISMDCEGLQPGDSGFSITPPAKSGPFCFLPQLPASDTSTPASVKSNKHQQLDDSCFGFENILSPQPLLISPVNRVSPVPSNASSSFDSASKNPSFQQSSTELSSLSGSMSGRVKKKRPLDVDLNRLLDPSAYQAKKVKKPKAKPDTLKKDFGTWEALMSAEFEDVEMHELTIES